MPSGFEDSNGNDLDNILENADLTKNINAHFETEGATGTGRYLTRTNSTADSNNNVGFITSDGDDLNKLYIRRDEIKKYEIRLSTVQYGNNYLESLLNTDPGPYLSNGGATLELTIAAISGTMIYISFPAGGETWTT